MVFEKVQNIIVDILAVDEEEITMDSSLEGDLEADSLDIVEIITAVEDEFRIQIPDEELQKMTKVSDLVEYIEAK